MRSWPYWLLAALLAVTVACLLGAIYDITVYWPAYRDAHHCVRTDDTRLILVGRVVAAENKWRCDGEETLWR